jgi:IS30 family transposase
MKAGLCQTEIAKIIGVHKSTISREMRRNRGLRGYRPKQAHRFSKIRRAKTAKDRISPDTWILVKHLLRDDWSPEQISGWLVSEFQITVSHESIYQFILKDKRQGVTFTCIYAVRKNVENVTVPPVTEVNYLTGYRLTSVLPLLIPAPVLVIGSLTQS